MTKQRKSLGNSGEDLAAKYLENKNYKILGRNVKLKFGEIDIIASNGDYIVIVEVKTKSIVNQGIPEEMVNFHKKKKLMLLANAISQNYPDKNVRIDVIAIDKTSDRTKINHIVNAIDGLSKIN
jgi:putative endonuclease